MCRLAISLARNTGLRIGGIRMQVPILIRDVQPAANAKVSSGDSQAVP
jgi:hypothetical protein